MIKKESIIHLTQYYETDQMGVIHHANYVKWMEDARHNYLKVLGINLADLNKKNIHMAVLSQNVKYCKAIKFDEKIEVSCSCNKLSSAKMSFYYEFYNVDKGYLCATGNTDHCLVDNKLNPLVLKKECPKEYNELLKSIE